MGYEYTHSYRTLLHLADSLAIAGIPTIRIDYHGTGSSPEDELSPQRVEAWVGGVQAAAGLLQEITGRPSSLCGVRLGATIAGLMASRFPINHLVAWAPVVSGRTYVRESEALARLAGAPQAKNEEFLEAGGFLLTHETAADLKSLSLTGLEYQVGGEALIVERDDLGAPSTFGSILTRRGIAVEVCEATGYLGMMDEPHSTVVPHATIRKITNWLSARIPWRAPSEAGAGLAVELSRVRQDKFGSEELVQLAGPAELFGVYTTPQPGVDREAPLLVLANSGAVHQVGPNRVYVELARALAVAGFSSLRLDLRNLGDSIRGGGAEENHPYPSTALEDLAYVVDWARTERNHQQVVIGGICSGAHAAFHAGLEIAHRSLVGALVVNPLTFQWHEGLSLQMPPAFQNIKRAKYYEGAIRRPEKWLRLIRGEADIVSIVRFTVRHGVSVVAKAARATLESIGLRRPSRLAFDLRGYRDRGRKVHFVFSRSDPGYGILMDQAPRAMRRLKRQHVVSVSFVEESDHTFSRKEWREELIGVVAAQLAAYATDDVELPSEEVDRASAPLGQ